MVHMVIAVSRLFDCGVCVINFPVYHPHLSAFVPRVCIFLPQDCFGFVQDGRLGGTSVRPEAELEANSSTSGRRSEQNGATVQTPGRRRPRDPKTGLQVVTGMDDQHRMRTDCETRRQREKSERCHLLKFN